MTLYAEYASSAIHHPTCATRERLRFVRQKASPAVGHHFVQWVGPHGRHVYVSGHGAVADDGSPAGPFGKVDRDVSLEEAYQTARQPACAVLASPQRSS